MDSVGGDASEQAKCTLNKIDFWNDHKGLSWPWSSYKKGHLVSMLCGCVFSQVHSELDGYHHIIPHNC